MELTFQTSPLHFLRCVVQEVRFHEETSDTIVPDSYPDIASILDCYAESILRGKECRDRNVTISGGIKGGILYQPENEISPRCLELYMPFSIKFDHPDLKENSQIIVSLRVRSVDSRMINSRKAMLRVNLGCEIIAYEQDKDELLNLVTEDTRIQLKKEHYSVQLPLETSEKSFVLNDALDLSGLPKLSRIYKTVLTVVPSDQKVVANKAIFKGNLSCKILYMTADQSMHCLKQQFPYSQYCDLTSDYDEESVAVYPVVTGYDLEPDHPDNPLSLQLNVHILMQCVVCGKKELDLITDAYSTSGSIDLQWKNYTFSTCLDQVHTQKPLRKLISGNVRSVMDTDLYWDYPVLQRTEDGTRIKIPVSIHVLCKDDKDTWVQRTERTEIQDDLSMDSSCNCNVTLSPNSDAYAVLTASGAEINASVDLHADCCSGSMLKTLCGATLEDTENSGKTAPSLIVKKIEKNTSIWDLAKHYRTTEHLIKSANGLNSDYIPENMLVLLPTT